VLGPAQCGFSLVYNLLLLVSLLFSTGASLGASSAGAYRITARPAAGPAGPEDYPFITVASTTSTEQSGLLGYLIPAFRQTSGIDVYVVAVGTGAALEIGKRGECDVVLVHDKTRELDFMRNGFGSLRREVMYNDFVVVGPRDDPAKIDATRDAVAALRKIAAAKARFVSRGDLSGTEAAEERLWAEAGGAPTAARDLWYVKTGGSMEHTLATAVSTNGYTLTDRSTWVNFRDRGELKIVVEDDPRLFNQYAVILVNPARHPWVKAQIGMAFIDWLTSPAGQAKIASYKVDGQQLFFPDYVKP
jgi:tungstate transport system substrate-binding protein